MPIYIIKHDGQPIGAHEGEAHLGALPWFADNVYGYSMAHALEHEGYSVEEVEEIDCHAVEGMLTAIAGRMGLSADISFVPFSQSRHAKPDKDGKIWESLNWNVVLKRRGTPFLISDYAQGIGHAPSNKLPSANPFDRQRQRAAAEYEMETGRIAKFFGRQGETPHGGKPISRPSLGEVISSLARDSDVMDYGGFQSWADEFGYDSDSISAKAIYDTCLETALKLRGAIGEAGLAELLLVARFN